MRGPDLSRAEAISLCRNQIATHPSGARNDRYIDSSRFLVPFLGFGPLLTNSRHTCYKRLTVQEFQMKKRCSDLAILLLALGFLAGCAGSRYPTHPQYKEHLQGIRTIALMPPYVKVYQLTVTGRGDLVEEWSETVWKNLAQATAQQAGPAGRFVLKGYDPASLAAAKQEYEDVGPLFDAVALSVLAHVYPRETQFETRRNRLDYSLGPLTSMTTVAEADAMLFVHVVAHIPTGGRVALEAVGVLTTMALGGGGPLVRGGLYNPGPLTKIVTALVHPGTGDLLWFHVRNYAGNPRVDATNAECLVSDALEDFREAVAGQDPKTKQPEHCGPGPEHLWR